MAAINMAKLANLETLSQEELLLLSRMAEQSERYEEMLDFVKVFISKSSSEVSVDERNIISVAFKNVVGNRRTA
jgi:14-3-3 family protein